MMVSRDIKPCLNRASRLKLKTYLLKNRRMGFSIIEGHPEPCLYLLDLPLNASTPDG